MRRFLISAVLVGGLLLAGPARAQGQIEVRVTLSDFKIEMSNTSLPAATPITFIVTNAGTVEHELVLEAPGAVNQPLEINGQVAEVAELEPGESETVTWTLPQADEYQFACHIPEHYESGMVLRFTAVAPAAAPAAAAPAPAPAAPAQLPKTSGAAEWLLALLPLALLTLGAGLALRARTRRAGL